MEDRQKSQKWCGGGGIKFQNGWGRGPKNLNWRRRWGHKMFNGVGEGPKNRLGGGGGMGVTFRFFQY